MAVLSWVLGAAPAGRKHADEPETVQVARRDKFDHVVIETTGLANPKPIIETFRAYQVPIPHFLAVTCGVPYSFCSPVLICTPCLLPLRGQLLRGQPPTAASYPTQEDAHQSESFTCACSLWQSSTAWMGC